MSSRDIASTTAWLESLKQIASQDKAATWHQKWPFFWLLTKFMSLDLPKDSMFLSLKDIEGEEHTVTACRRLEFLWVAVVLARSGGEGWFPAVVGQVVSLGALVLRR
ncbi:hypothetical protein RHMOL_Rhmol12G0202100 [Rhododendron molle]|uniref:Uncharacterized protein n=1 Tax=Rhododendron molle TaxID=49168 RepID=A0ACC0LKS2_RHOML|nr:hypothetical protein RHMOL_Rhmol12G0202100 [Rhododendron molle]